VFILPLKEEEKQNIIEVAKAFGVKKLWLFGSCLDAEGEPNDIDLAVEGVPSEQFFKFYARLDMVVSKQVDLVDMDSKNEPIRHIVRKRGQVIYGG
jgi:predicted nucleotidyltransferase